MFFFSLIWSFPVCEMARGQHRIADLRRQLENWRDNERNQNWGNLLHPPYQRLRGHWERAWNCCGWPCHSPLVTIVFFKLFSSIMNQQVCSEELHRQGHHVEHRRYWFHGKSFRDSPLSNWHPEWTGEQTKSCFSSKTSLYRLILGLFLLLGEQCSRGATLLQPVWLPKSQP